jgi:hypothetical protein
MKDYSQFGESKILYEIFEKIGYHNKFGVEFGASDGYWLSNLRMFLDLGWTGLQMEGLEENKNDVKAEFITKDNINDLFEKYHVPHKFDLLSIDLDGNDYWIWKEIKHEPNVVIIEFNAHFDTNTKVVIEYDSNHVWDFTYAYGASFKSMLELAEQKGYYLYNHHEYVDLIFIKKEFENILPSIFNFETFDIPKDYFPRILKNNKKFIEI